MTLRERITETTMAGNDAHASAADAGRRPRIAYVLKKYPRLSETFILNEILGVEAVGIDVDIHSLRTPDDARFHADVSRVRGDVRYLPPFRAGTALDALRSVAEFGDLEPLSRALAFADRLPAEKRTGILFQALHLASAIRTRGIDHCHVHFMTIAAQTTYLAHLFTGIPFSVTAHAKDVYRHTVDASLFAEIGAAATAVVTVCDANRAFIESRLTNGAPVRVERVYNGIPADAFRAAFDTAAIRPKPRQVVAIGRLVEKKGFDVLLDAFAVLRDRGVDFNGVFVGDGDQRGALEVRCASLDLDDRVAFLGARTRDDTLRELAASRLLAAPCSIGADGNQDALPTVLIEALALGIPAVTTPVGGIPEIVSDGEEGTIVPPDDPAALADAIAVILDDDDRHRAMAQRARAKCDARFHRDRTIPALLDAIGVARPALTRKSPT